MRTGFSWVTRAQLVHSWRDARRLFKMERHERRIAPTQPGHSSICTELAAIADNANNGSHLTRSIQGASWPLERYLDNSDRADRLSGGVQCIPIATPHGRFKVWTKRVGNNPRVKLLLLHGGPGATHEYFEACDSYLPAAGIEYYYYDQLGSYYSDQPDIPELWEIPRFVDEVEQVRAALGLNADNFFLLGHSWGGILAIEYALRYQQQLKGLVISNMMASIPAYNDYAERVLMPTMDAVVLAEIKRLEAAEDYANPRYMELLLKHHYVYHVLRMPLDKWPDPVERAFKHLNPKVYIPMQGPSELGASGKLAAWDRSAELRSIGIPTLTVGAHHDTMDPQHMQSMARSLPHGRYLDCPEGSHMAMFDDQERYFRGLIRFLSDVDNDRMSSRAPVAATNTRGP
jgi:proline iminopeptidase